MRVLEKLKPVRKPCETCGITPKGCLKGCRFINIAQVIPVHYFCSKKCKFEWIFRNSRK